MKYLSLFSGIGGFELGIQQAYEDSKSNRQQQEGTEASGSSDGVSPQSKQPIKSEEWGNISCIGYSEIDKYAVQIYQKHFNHKNYGDITTLNPIELPNFDLLVGGFPCQAFSIAGKRGGFMDTRGTLFFEIRRIVREKQPRLLLLENVKGLLSHDQGRTFRIIISTLDELGYDLQWQVLNSKNFGVPQNRERVFIIGHLRGTSRPEVFPFGESNTKNLEQIIGGGQGNRLYDPKGISTTIASQAGGQGAKTGLYCVGGLQKNAAKMKDRSPALTEAMGKGGGHIPIITGIDTGGLQETATAIDANYHKGHGQRGKSRGRTLALDNSKIRRLTPTECMRLQGFPDDWCDGIGISDSQKYKVAGNAVTVNVVREIVKKL